MRRIVPALAAVAMLAAFAAPAHAAEARIGGFPFFCQTSGPLAKPKFGHIQGALFDLPAQREECLRTVERNIRVCTANTDFARNIDNRRYARCLPVFERRAKACVAFFHREKSKCDAGAPEPS